MPPFAFLAGIVLAFCYGESVFAFTVSDAINAVGPTLPTGGSFGEIIRTVAESFIPFAAVAAALAMTMSGFFMTITGNENQTTTARRVFISSLAALALINIIPTFSSLLISPTFPSGGSTILSASTTVGGAMAAEALGLVAFLEIPLGILCVIMIIVSGVRAIANFGSEDGVTQLRRTVLFVVAGFILVYTRSLLGLGIVAGTPQYHQRDPRDTQPRHRTHDRHRRRHAGLRRNSHDRKYRQRGAVQQSKKPSPQSRHRSDHHGGKCRNRHASGEHRDIGNILRVVPGDMGERIAGTPDVGNVVRADICRAVESCYHGCGDRRRQPLLRWEILQTREKRFA